MKNGAESQEITVESDMVMWPAYCACCEDPNPTKRTVLCAPEDRDVSQNVPICEKCDRHVPRVLSSTLLSVLGLLLAVPPLYAVFRYGDTMLESIPRMLGFPDNFWLGLIVIGLLILMVVGSVVVPLFLLFVSWGWLDDRKRLRQLRPECLPGDDPVGYVSYRAGVGDQPPVHVFRFLVPRQGPGYAQRFVEANGPTESRPPRQPTAPLIRALASDNTALREKAIEAAIEFAREGSSQGLEAIEAAIRFLHCGSTIEFHSPGLIMGQAEDVLERGVPEAKAKLREMAANDQLWETSPAEVQRLLSLATTLTDPTEFLEEIHAEFGDRQTQAIQLYWAAMSARAILARRSEGPDGE